ncbi:MAG TPA: hypothetical protein PKW76_12200 [bacterium]|nr:hypothetical protein [bacterium]HPG46434.1 hypothetical protein [bacterium]HPM98653.1 hypothetical protein [bacterium]
MNLVWKILLFLKEWMQLHPIRTVILALLIWAIMVKSGANLVKWTRWGMVILYGAFALKYHQLLADKAIQISRGMGLQHSRLFSQSLDYNWYQGFMTGAMYMTLFCIFLFLWIYEYKKSAKKPSNLDAKTTGTVRFPI